MKDLTETLILIFLKEETKLHQLQSHLCHPRIQAPNPL